MRNLLIILSLLTFSLSQEWMNSYGGDYNDRFYSIQQIDDGGYISTGFTSSYGNGSGDIWLVKTNDNGIMEWSKTYGGSDWEYGYSVLQTNEGGFIIGGISQGDIYIIKTDSNGNIEWEETYGGDENESITEIIQTPDGGYVFVGITNSYGQTYYPNYDIWVVKIDSEGLVEWENTYYDPSSVFECEEEFSHSPQNIIITNDNKYAISGFIPFCRDESFLLIINEDGSLEWIKTFDEPERIFSMQQTQDGDFVLFGVIDWPYDWSLTKTDNEGNV